MRNKILIFSILFSLLFCLDSCKKDKLAPKGITESWDITSANTGTTYTMTVFYPDKQFPSTPVPVVYVLDGFWWKDMAGEVISDLGGSGKIPKCLMVSLDYKKGDGAYARGTDLNYPGEGVEGTPQAPKFFEFLKSELLPKVDTKYNCDTSKRILFGHSLAGEFVLYSMLDNATHPLFKKCIAASCSIGLGVDNYVFGLERQVATQVSDLPVTLYMGVGTYVGSATIMHQEFYNRIKSRGYPNLKIGFKTYPEQHGTDPYPTFRDGIQFVFSN
jgi:predicted alpha/beta superfamily hydrolase